ncbi:hypothetical protein RLOC_00003170 [Lonchura striata]|uniref:Uncharacterized protein n=1 Tax=Lonchura striata TaxID=40157 RepID=A0A218V3G7_9PASE|nr:hypothetical protein RLOC_00003170 [Lonchura striata domestica]
MPWRAPQLHFVHLKCKFGIVFPFVFCSGFGSEDQVVISLTDFSQEFVTVRYLL